MTDERGLAAIPKVTQQQLMALLNSTVDAIISIDEQQGHMFYFSPGVSLQDIVTSVNEVGAAPGDLMAILEALKEAGALRAELVVI